MISGPHRRVGIGAVARGTLRRLGSLMITFRNSFRHEIILTRRLSLLAVPFRLPGRISRRSLVRLVLTHEANRSHLFRLGWPGWARATEVVWPALQTRI